MVFRGKTSVPYQGNGWMDEWMNGGEVIAAAATKLLDNLIQLLFFVRDRRQQWRGTINWAPLNGLITVS